MSLRCPRCGGRIGRWHAVGFLRLFSIACPRCHTLLAIENRGRYWLWGCIIGAVPVGAVVQQFVDSPAVLPVTVVAGFVVGAYVATRVGRIAVSPEEPDRRSREA